MAIGNCPRCGGKCDDENEYCNDCIAQDEADDFDPVLEQAIMHDFNNAPPGFEIVKPFKVGDRVDLLARVEDTLVWFPGKIIGSGINSCGYYWQVRMDDEPNALEWHAVPQRDASEFMRHSDAPMPDKSGQLTERQKASGRFAPTPPTPEHLDPIVTLMSGFRVGDMFEFISPNNNVTQYEITAIYGESVNYSNTVGESVPMRTTRGFLANRIRGGYITYKPLLERTQGNKLPEPVTPYDLKPGDYLYAGEELVKIIDENSQQYLFERSQGVPVQFSISYVLNCLRLGLWKLASASDSIAALNREADRLDQLVVDTIDQRAKIVQQIEALRAKQK